MSQRLTVETENPWNALIAFSGADSDNDSKDSKDNIEDEDEDDTDDGDGDTGEDGKSKDKSSDTISKADFDALNTRMKAADRAKSAAEARVKEFEDKDKSELEQASSQLEEANATIESMSGELTQAQISAAFVADNKYKWKNPATALRLADLSEVTIEDGKVNGLDKALETLAKSDPYLLDTGDSEDEALKTRTAAGGTPKRGDKNKAKREELIKKYPALRR